MSRGETTPAKPVGDGTVDYVGTLVGESTSREFRMAVARDPPGLRAAQAGHGAQHGRLAGARGSDQRDGLALGAQAELEPVCAKGDGDVELERRHVESSL